MPQVSRFPLDKKVWEKIFELFLEGIVASKDKEAANFFVDAFLAPTEKVMLAKRFAIFFLLEKETEGKEIARILKVSTSTVSRLKLWKKSLKKGQTKILERIILKREIKNLLGDVLNLFAYGGLPPKGRSWQEWGRKKWLLKKERKSLLR